MEGEVIEANFEEGDVVEKGQVLYRIDASSIDSDLSSAQTSLQRAKESVQTAQSAYAGETARIAGNTYRSTASGYIKTLYIKEGDKVNSGTKIADLYDDSVMKITAPFLSGEAAEINVGDEAAVILEDTGEQISGTVTVVSSMEETLSGGRLVKNVTVEVSNPGGLTTDTAASVTVDGFVCSAEGTFKAKTETTLSVELSGNKSLEIENLLIHEGSYVDKNSDLFQVTAKTAEEYLKEFKDAVESADDNLENAENKLDNTQDSVDDYTITAPISGTVITKNAKVGDKISKNSSGTTTMAVIYDLSTMTLEMSVDELDVANVKVGQSVEVTADAGGRRDIHRNRHKCEPAEQLLQRCHKLSGDSDTGRYGKSSSGHERGCEDHSRQFRRCISDSGECADAWKQSVCEEEHRLRKIRQQQRPGRLRGGPGDNWNHQRRLCGDPFRPL